VKESGKRHGEAYASRRLGQALFVVPFFREVSAAARPQERAAANSRPHPNQLVIWSLPWPPADFSAATTDEGSAKAITASALGL
jgi:hypothetical protein